MHLQLVDWIIVVLSVAICFIPALFFGKRSGKNTAEFFASGRSVPWWLAGLSMVATTFSSDTPNLVTNFVRTQGTLGHLALHMAFCPRRNLAIIQSYICTIISSSPCNHSGRAASAVRGFRAIYLGFFFNCMIMASVNLAACKIAAVLFGLERWQTLLAVGVLNVVFAAHSGLWGVLVIDMIQFFIKMSAVIAAAYFAVNLPQVGGLSGLVQKVSERRGPGGLDYLSMLPDFSGNWDLVIAVFIMPLAVQWWAVWYPGAEPGGGSYIAQRMLASKSEKDALGGTLFFNVAHYVLRPWPWLLVALASILVYPELSDIQRSFPHVDPKLIGHDIAFPAMLLFLPVGWMGLIVGGLIAANSSTILTHLNWGSSYLVHDFYRRFVSPGKDEKHYVAAGRVSIGLLFVCSSALVYALETAQDNFNIMLQVGAGSGLLYLLRWFWWRVTAWCEIVAMIASFGISIVFLILHRNGVSYGTHKELLLTVMATTICWLVAAFFGPPTAESALIDFYKKVRPFGPGWKHIRILAGETEAEAAAHLQRENIPLALVGWFSGSVMIWSSLFAVGNFLYGRMHYAAGLCVVFAISLYMLIRVVRRLWN
ncbi:MAG: Na+:solute symporter [Candidatus Solibacter usitatus]|nr:Na+:solute symporter [Candidatus Solibacter usitatus]